MTATEGCVGAFRWAWHVEVQGGSHRGGDRLFARVDESQATFLLADVSGNGPTAADAADALALFLANLQPAPLDPAALLRTLHTRLCQHWAASVDDYWFVDALAVRLTLSTGTIEAASGGAPNVWVREMAGWARWEIPSGGYIGGPDENAVFVVAARPLDPGGMLFAATDGVTDARDPDGAFGVIGVSAALASAGGAEPRNVVGAVFDAVRTFAKSSWPSSDATGLIFGW
ncbi:SpoIIE family protein phosphatase [Frigoriglobus tundricola]|uniref:SpoIIE family protein phosphatase n=1 Tax=Frigoriglobus tundricola TaxID=2774151 RepID=UPI00148EB4BD|nr:SpoIIE family protein phosphatase [Frigoriglobus tundricola]